MEFFENKIRPVLAQHCYKCHSTQSKKLKAELYLDNRERALQGGESGPSIIPGKADSSLLYRAVLYKEESLEMPPTRKLPDAVIADFKRWIDMGALGQSPTNRRSPRNRVSILKNTVRSTGHSSRSKPGTAGGCQRHLATEPDRPVRPRPTGGMLG